MKQSEVRCLPEVKMVFPEFKKRSLIMLLQFLYTGEVGNYPSQWWSLSIFSKSSIFQFSDLISASQLLVEFQELCKILKLNPQVRKIKSKDDSSSSAATASSSTSSSKSNSSHSQRKHNCPKCQSAFDKTSKLIFHREQCTSRPSTSTNEMKVESSAKASNIDLFNKESEDTSVESTSNDIDENLDASGFQMPDNFDLPDEIIQEQLPAARYTSTPIQYANKDENREVKRKMEKPAEKKSLKQTKGFAEDLAEKRRRIMLKLRGDEIPTSSSSMERKGTKTQRPLKDSFRKQAKNSAAGKVQNSQAKKRKYQQTSSSSESESESEDEKWRPRSRSEDESTDEEVIVKPSFSRSLLSGGNKKLAVRVELNGEERIMELFEYRLSLLKEEDEPEEGASSTIKPLKLAKVGKRIKRIVSEGSSSDENSGDNFASKVKKTEESHPQEPKVISAKKIEHQPAAAATSTSSTTTSSLIAKLPRMWAFFNSNSTKFFLTPFFLFSVPKLPRIRPTIRKVMILIPRWALITRWRNKWNEKIQ